MTDPLKQVTLEELERRALFAFLDDGAEQVAATVDELALAPDEKVDLTDLNDPTTRDRKGLMDYCCEVFEAMCPSYHVVFTRRMLANHSTIQLKHLVAMLQEIMDSEVAAERSVTLRTMQQEDFQLSPSVEIKDDQTTPTANSDSNYALMEGSSGVIDLTQISSDEMLAAVEDTADAANVALPEYCESCGQEVSAERSLLGLTLCVECYPDSAASDESQTPPRKKMTQLGSTETVLFPADPDDSEKKRWQDEGGT